MFYISIPRFLLVTLATVSPPVHGLAVETYSKRQDAYHWINTWTSMPQLVESGNMPPSQFVGYESFAGLHDSNILPELWWSLEGRDTPANFAHVRRSLED